ncbi:MAG: hypothetical protein ACRYFS_18630 [Janthinobacterium lividum]
MAVAEKKPSVKPIEKEAGYEEWLQAVNALIDDVEMWAREWLISTGWTPAYGWDVLKRNIEIADEFSTDLYPVEVLEINSRPDDIKLGRDTKLVLEPVFYKPVTGIGRVDFYVWPAMYRVRLLHKTGRDKWIVKTDSHVNWPLPWNQESFILIAEDLLGI